MAVLTNPLTPYTSLTPVDPTTQKLAELEARIAKLEGVLQIVGTDVTLKCPTTLTIDVGSTTSLKAGQSVNIEAGTSMNLKGWGTMTVQASGSMTVQAAGNMVLKGSTIAIN